MSRNFIWKGNSNNGIHLVGWHSITQAKKDGGLGVRLARETNTAMLGKLVWDIQQNSNKPWVRMMQDKYLNNKNFFSSPRSYGSPIWNSIFKAKLALQDGYLYRIGNGASSFLYSPWLLKEPLCRMVDYVAIQDTHLRIRDIFMNDGWNLNLLYTSLHPDVIDSVMKTHLSINTSITDCFIWNNDMNGVYSVSSGYNWLLQQRISVHNNNSWTWIWKIAAPEKIKFFIWSACHHAIPTLSLLRRRNLAQSNICPRCSSSEETILHCIRDCHTAQRIWNSLGFRTVEFFNPSEPEVWLRVNSSGNKAPLFLAGLWWNWRARNLVCVGNETIQQFRIVAESHKLATLIGACFPTRTLIDNPPRLISWHPCRTNCMVLNVDGSCLGNPGRAGFGGLIRNGDGDWHLGFSGFLGIANNTLAELMALYHGLKIARTYGYHRFFCYSDSKTVLDLVIKGYNNYHCYAAVIANIQDLLKLDWDVSLFHTLREGNVCVDFLAKLGSTNDEKLLIWESPPSALKELISADALRVAYPRA